VLSVKPLSGRWRWHRGDLTPTQPVPVVRLAKESRELDAVTWALVRCWAKDLSGVKPINARAETMFEKPMFRNAT
jgi:putative SOS response-associated peptidase YedK